VEDIPVPLERAGDGHEPRAQKGFALLLPQVLPHHGIDVPRLVFQGHEGDALGAAGPLAVL